MKRFAIAGALSLALVMAAHGQQAAPGGDQGPPLVHDLAGQWTALTVIEGNFTKSMGALMQDYQRVLAENARLKADLEKLKTPAPSSPPNKVP